MNCEKEFTRVCNVFSVKVNPAKADPFFLHPSGELKKGYQFCCNGIAADGCSFTFLCRAVTSFHFTINSDQKKDNGIQHMPVRKISGSGTIFCFS